MNSSLRLRVREGLSQDVGRGLARLHPADMQRLGLRTGDVVLLQGDKLAVGKVLPGHRASSIESQIQIDGILRNSIGCALDSFIEIKKVSVNAAQKLVMRSLTLQSNTADPDFILGFLDGVPVQAGTMVRVTLFGNESHDFEVESVEPEGPVIITPKTELRMIGCASQSPHSRSAYEDIGGAKQQLSRIREIVDLPLRYPELFERLGVDAPCGVLLYGPPGCGKTLIARTLAHESDASFFTISGPEIIHKHYGESESHLRKIFQEAEKASPSIIFLDEIDAIAPKRDDAAGDVERRVVAQLLTLMDGLKRRGRVIVIAATNRPNALDPALRRPGRFDREIEITAPDRNGRYHILQIHTRGMPLADDVRLEEIANATHGFVGADLESLCREAAMVALRRFIENNELDADAFHKVPLSNLCVRKIDFDHALKVVYPSAIREVFVEVPNVTWNQVGGHASVKEKLMEAVIWPLQHQAYFEQLNVSPPRGILLSGPPGCGKTLLARALATEGKVNFISIKGPELVSKFVGESEKALREVFQKAKQSAPCILFFDEIDGLCGSRQANQNDSGVSTRVLTQLLSELDGIEELRGVFVLGATNRPELVDVALKRFGRFEETLEIGLPDKESRKQIFEVHLKGKSLAEKIPLEELAEISEGLSGADIAAVCSQAARQAIRRCVRAAEDSTPEPSSLALNLADLTSGIENLKQRNAKRGKNGLIANDNV